ncbi:uncharacterized protein LOC103524330 [Diaphorina citri]|uniref:Uncharacterized protein LOC103524330 n=1 Tax=Diaphorina citri TaxID=121845 RepID=A0A3Q0JLI3_DIACI|nr:uncharacterized protein LOC103524330 [Diaphorina citri]
MSEADQRYILAQLQESLASADSDNPYRILVQKYEELVRAQRKIQSQSGDGVGSGGQPLSLQEELEMSGLDYIVGRSGGGTQSSGPNSGSLGYHDSAPLSLQEELETCTIQLRIYEQLEVSIQELERNNQRLLFDHTNDKKTIKTQLATIESLENRCDELQLSVNELSVELEKEKRHRQSAQTQGERKPSCAQQYQDEEVSGLLKELQEMKAQRTRDLRKITDLEDNIANVIQENASLEQRLTAISEREQDFKTMQEELSTLEDIRQGHLCRRCLRIADDNRSCLGDEDDETASLIESLMSEADQRYILAQLQESLASADSDNPYR